MPYLVEELLLECRKSMRIVNGRIFDPSLINVLCTSTPGRNVTKHSHSPLQSKQFRLLTSEKIRGFHETV